MGGVRKGPNNQVGKVLSGSLADIFGIQSFFFLKSETVYKQFENLEQLNQTLHKPYLRSEP